MLRKHYAPLKYLIHGIEKKSICKYIHPAMINVAIIEDNARYRQTLSIILQLDESFKLIHKLPDCNDMMKLFSEEKPDVVIMDIDLPGISGIQAVWKLKTKWPEIKVLMLTVF